MTLRERGLSEAGIWERGGLWDTLCGNEGFPKPGFGKEEGYGTLCGDDERVFRMNCSLTFKYVSRNDSAGTRAFRSRDLGKRRVMGHSVQTTKESSA